MRGAQRTAGSPASEAAPLVWSFDGPFAVCLADLEDALRRAIHQVGSAKRMIVAIDVSLPALERRVREGDTVQPAWRESLERIRTSYGLPAAPRVRYRQAPGALLTLAVLYRR